VPIIYRIQRYKQNKTLDHTCVIRGMRVHTQHTDIHTHLRVLHTHSIQTHTHKCVSLQALRVEHTDASVFITDASMDTNSLGVRL
jgi:hypothetical protein